MKEYCKIHGSPMKGKHMSEYQKEKLREVNIGRQPWNKGTKGIMKSNCGSFKNGKENINYGRTTPTVIGDNCHLWKGGISFEPYGLEFNKNLKEQIRKRDNFRCQECFRHQDELRTKTNKLYKLMIHHIDFNKQNNNPNNLISLCRNCHSQSNFNREDWTSYYQNKIVMASDKN
jgi:hypothetical protein